MSKGSALSKNTTPQAHDQKLFLRRKTNIRDKQSIHFNKDDIKVRSKISAMDQSGNVSAMTLPAIKPGDSNRSPSTITPMGTNKKFYRVSDNSDPMSLSPKMVTQLRLNVKLEEDVVEDDKSSTRGMTEI